MIATTIRRKATNLLKSSMAISTMSLVTTKSSTRCEQGKNNETKGGKIPSFESFQKSITEFDMQKILDSAAISVGAKVQDAVDSGLPTQVSYGFICGFSSGYALKKAGKIASVVFGLGFVTLQSLSYTGYIQVNHDRIQKDVEGLLDVNKDGKVDKEDANVAMDKLMDVLNFNMPGGSGFGAGFIGGLRSG